MVATLKTQEVLWTRSRETHNNGTITCNHDDGCCCTEPQIIDFPTNTAVVEGEGVYFKIEVSGVPPPTVTWYHNGEPVKDDYAHEIKTDGSLDIPSVELKHSGVYKAVAKNQYGSEEKEADLTVSKERGAKSTIDGEVVSTRPIPISEFGRYVAGLHVDSNQPFKDLYQVCFRP